MRVCLFGVDGLTFRIVDMLLERGLLPNFQRLEERGVRGVLQSTVPLLTPPARLESAHVYDIVPTILSRMNLPMLGDLDGSVLEEAFIPGEPLYANHRSRSIREILRSLEREDVK